ncbi:Transcription initiation factor IIB [Orchesella cincta]|uniref:Transcription initiation factor IIB n=1 Tax=Orchesella cincta TaxID=48709 RepID=A0A1D2M377_ORCCI|nr:Transcription initiation factor IIB [Orchesella cincta]
MSRVDFEQAPEAPLVEDVRAGGQLCSERGLVVSDRHIGGGRGAAAFDELGNAKYNWRKAISSGDRALMNASKEISQIADRLALPKTVVDRANNLFKMIHDGKKLKSRSTDAISSACLCIASRQEGVPRTFKEVSAVSQTSKKEIGRVFKLIQAHSISPWRLLNGDVMSRFCSHLGLPNSVMKAAAAIAKTAEELGIVTGRSPLSVAAAAIYMASQASKCKRSQKDIADVAGVVVVTVRQVYRLMYPRAVKLFPKDFVFFTPIDKLPVY